MAIELMQYIDANPIIEHAKSINCPYVGIIGGKFTGKTYGCVDYALRDFYAENSGRPFFYARRYDKTFTTSICGNLINCHRQDIINLSGGYHNAGEFRGKIYTLQRNVSDKNGELTRKAQKTIAYCRSLNNVETETGDDKGELSCVIYDEFLTRGEELRDEFNKLMILHANALRGRTDRYVPLFLLGNTVSRDSAVAERFGISLRDCKRGLNVFSNRAGVPRIVLYYTPETSKGVEAAELYYDRFEDDHINMISHGDWTLGTYKIASVSQLMKSGITFKLFDRGVCVHCTIYVDGYTPVMIIKKPSDIYDYKVSPIISPENLTTVPKIIIDCVKSGAYFAETPEIGEDFRDICKHITGGTAIVNMIE